MLTEYTLLLRSFACFVLLLFLGLAFPAEAMPKKPLILAGDVLISEVQGSIFLAVDGTELGEAPDGRCDRLFALQRPATSPPAIEVAGPVENALLYFDGKTLAIRSPQLERDLVLTIEDPSLLEELSPFGVDPFHAAPPGDRKAKTELAILTGVGLIHREGVGDSMVESLRQFETAAPTLAAAISAGARRCPDGEGNGNVQCWSGGCGATSCSGSCVLTPSCGISCSPGYFACCGCDFWAPSGCHCYSNEECGC